MLYREIIAVCSEIHTKHINKLCGQNVELLNVKLVIHIVTTGLQSVKLCFLTYRSLQQYTNNYTSNICSTLNSHHNALNSKLTLPAICCPSPHT